MKNFSKLAFILPIAATTISYAAGFEINSARSVTLQDIQEYYEEKAEEESASKRVEIESEETAVENSVSNPESERKILAITNVSSLEKCIGKKGKVISDFENYRTSPFGDIIGQIAKGIEVTITGVDGDWFIINMGGGDAYILSKAVKVEGFNKNYPDDGTVSEDVKVYDRDGYEIGELNAGEDIEIIGDYGTYWKFMFDNKEAFVVKAAIDTDADGDDEPSDENKSNDIADNDSDDDEEEIAADDEDDSNNVDNNKTQVATTDSKSNTATNTDTKINTETKTNTNTNNSESTSQSSKKDSNTVTFNTPTTIIKSDKETSTNTTAKTTKTNTETKKDNKTEAKKDNITEAKTSGSTNNNQYISGLGDLLSPSKVTTSVYKKQSIGSNWDESGIDFTHVQGICCDGTYFYIALLTSAKNGDYTNQYTKILKLNMKTKKIVKAKRIGKIGHSNSLCYNTKNKKIYSATCTNKMSYWCEIDTDLTGYKKVYPKDKKGKKYTNKNFASFSYDPVKDQYVVKMSNKQFGFFDQNFKLIKTVSAQHMKINDSMTGQAIYTDGKNIFSQCGNLSARPTVNYILCYDMNGKYLQKITLSKLGSTSEHAELEQLTGWKGKYYTISNCSGFRIHSIKLRK